MLDFRPTAAPRNYLSRKEARRTFWWIMALGLAVLLIVRFGEIRQFLGNLRGQPAQDIDTRYYPSPKSDTDVNAVTIVPQRESHTERPANGAFEIDSSLLAEIRDDTPWIRPSEYPAWYHFWTVLKELPSETLSDRAQPVGFVELFQQPKAFRGKPVTIEGSARRATYVKVDDPQSTVAGYYRVIVWPKGGPPEPIFLYCLELPAGLPTGDEIAADITATGLFFKRMVYPTELEGELRRAPVIMARSLDWLQPQSPTTTADNNTVRFVIAATVIGIILLVVLLSYIARSSAPRHSATPTSLPEIRDVETPDVHKSLQELEEEHP
jgi:hypothetical protein